MDEPTTLAALASAPTSKPLSRLQLFASGLRDNESGAALIEFALVATTLAAGIVGIVDISNAFSRKLAIEQGAQRAIEKIMQTTQDETVDATIKSEAVCQVNGTNSAGVCNTSPITAADVSVTYRLECTTTAGVTTAYLNAAVATDCPSGQRQSQYVSVTINHKYTPMFALRFMGVNADGTYHVTATAGMRTQ